MIVVYVRPCEKDKGHPQNTAPTLPSGKPALAPKPSDLGSPLEFTCDLALEAGFRHLPPRGSILSSSIAFRAVTFMHASSILRAATLHLWSSCIFSLVDLSWFSTRCHMDACLETRLPGDLARVMQTAAKRDGGAAAQTPALEHLSERVTALEAWMRNQVAMPETHLATGLVDALEQMQIRCDRQLAECQAETVRRIGTLAELLTAVEKRVSFSERDLAKGVARLREQVSFCHANLVPAAKCGTANVRGNGCGARLVSARTCGTMKSDVVAATHGKDRVARWEGICNILHEQTLHLDSKLCVVERVLQDLEQGMDEMRQKCAQYDDHLVNVSVLRGKPASEAPALSDSTILESQSEISAVNEDALSIRTQVRWMTVAIEK